MIPTGTPNHIRLITRTITGLRIWFVGVGVAGRRFNYTIEGTTLLLDEVDLDARDGTLARSHEVQCEWAATPLHGEKLRLKVDIAPIEAAGKLAYVIPDIPDLHEPPPKLGVRQVVKSYERTLPSGQRGVTNNVALDDNLPKPEEIEWTEEAIRWVLAQVRDIETKTAFRIGHTGNTGLAIFTRRIS